MRSLNVTFTGKCSVELREEEVPELKPGQILVETKRSLISTGTECICYSRNFEPGTHWDQWVHYPFHPGYSSVGCVLEVASDVKNVRPGDRVTMRVPHGQYCVKDARDVERVPEGVSDCAAVWFALACIVQNGVRRARHELGDVVVVIGLGLLGQLAVQYTRLFGAREVVAIDMAPRRLEMAKAHGATQVLGMNADQAKESVKDLTGGRLADVVYDITGHPAVFPSALGLARRFGKLLLLGDTGTPSAQCLTPDVVTRGVSIVGAHDNDPPSEATDHVHWTRANMASLFFSYLLRGQMRVEDLITHHFSPMEAADAYSLLMTDRATAMGVVFDWSKMG